MAQRQEHPQQPQNQPIHADKNRIPVNLTLIFALVVAAIGLYGVLNTGSLNLTLIAGLGVGIYSWLTSPREYLIYQNALVIQYGRPRVKVIYFNQISHLEMLSLAIGDRLRVRLNNGRREVLQTRDIETFHNRLQQALDDYRRTHPESAPPEQSPGA